MASCGEAELSLNALNLIICEVLSRILTKNRIWAIFYEIKLVRPKDIFEVHHATEYAEIRITMNSPKFLRSESLFFGKNE